MYDFTYIQNLKKIKQINKYNKTETESQIQRINRRLLGDRELEGGSK